MVVSIWLSSVSSCSAGDLRLRAAIERIDGQLGLLAQARYHRAEAVFRQGENHRDGLHLRDHRQGRGSGGLHHVARIDQPQTDPAGDRSGDVADTRPAPGRIAPCPGRSLPCPASCRTSFSWSSIICLAMALRAQRGAVALEIHLRLGEHVFVSLQRALRLQQRRPVGARIDINQRIAFVDALALLVCTAVTMPFTWLVMESV